MIRLWIPSFYDNDRAKYSNTRAVDDGENYEIIGCSCGSITTKLIKGLKEHNIRSPYLHITKISYDNYCGIREIINDSWFTPRGLYCPDPQTLLPENIENQEGFKHLQVEVMNLQAIISEAKEKGIRVTYLDDGQIIKHGDIKIVCYRNRTDVLKADDATASCYINKSSVYYWFPDLKYFATGDGCDDIYEMCVSKKINPIFLKLPNHGRNITWEQAQKLKDSGVLYCWDNSDEHTDGKKYCIQSGITYLDCHTDINVAFANGKAILEYGGNNYIYKVPYDKGNFEEGWVKNFNGWWYRYSDGSWAVGWRRLKLHGKDAWFYFDGDGYTVTGWHYLRHMTKDEKNWFYFDPVNGNMKSGWVSCDGLWYYFDEIDGMHKGWLDYEGKKCYFEPSTCRDKSPAYRSRIVLIGDDVWEFDSNCYGKQVCLQNYEGV